MNAPARHICLLKLLLSTRLCNCDAGLTKDDFVEAMEAAVERALKRHKSEQLSISKFTEGAWDHMSLMSGLEMVACLPNELENVVDDSTAARGSSFTLDDRPEASQADRYASADHGV